MAASALALFRADYGRLVRRELVLCFDVLAWVWYAEDEGVGLQDIGKQEPEKLIKGLCWAAYRSHEVGQAFRRPKLTRKQVEDIIDGLPRKKTLELYQHIQGTRIFGRTPEEYAAEVGMDEAKKKSRRRGAS
jgi:hypothetical protein